MLHLPYTKLIKKILVCWLETKKNPSIVSEYPILIEFRLFVRKMKKEKSNAGDGIPIPSIYEPYT